MRDGLTGFFWGNWHKGYRTKTHHCRQFEDSNCIYSKWQRMGPRIVRPTGDMAGCKGYWHLDDRDGFYYYGSSRTTHKKCYNCGIPLWSALMHSPTDEECCILCWRSSAREQLIALAKELSEHCQSLEKRWRQPISQWGDFLIRCAEQQISDVPWDVERELVARVTNLITDKDYTNLGFILVKMLKNKTTKIKYAKTIHNASERTITNFYFLVVRELNANYPRLRCQEDHSESRACQSA